MSVLMTWFGSFVCVDRRTGALSHRALDEIPPNEAVAEASEETAPDGTAVLTLDRPVLHPSVRKAPGDDAPIRLFTTPAERPGTVNIRAQARRLSARADGRLAETGSNGGWEMFLVLSDSQLAMLRLLRANHWVRRSTGRRVSPADIVARPGFLLAIGRDILRMPHDLPVAEENADGASPAPLTLFFDGWRIEELVLYRPLVFVVAFGDPGIFELMTLCIRSLVAGGRYDGDILVIGDRSHAELIELLPEIPAERLHAYQLRAGNFIEYCAARYCLPDWLDAARYQPFLYVDVDVMFDRPLQPFLQRLVLQSKICAQAEPFARLAAHAASGARLIKQDRLKVGDTPGFNSGIIGIPSLVPHGRTLRRIHELVFRYADVEGRDALNHFDQAIANYVTVKLAPIDYKFLTPRVRYTQRQVMYGGEEPLGFVHFWGSGKQQRQVMQDLLTSLTTPAEG